MNVKMEKTFQLLIEQFKELTAFNSVGAVQTLKIIYEGSQTPLQKLATISSLQGRIVVRPYDPTQLKEMENAIQKANLGLGIMKEKSAIVLSVPNQSMEQREKLAGRVKILAEEARISIRNIRRDAKKLLDAEKSEDVSSKGKKELQEITDSYIKKIDELTQRKTISIMKA